MARPDGMSEDEFDREANLLVNRVSQRISRGLTRKMILPMVLVGAALLYGFLNGSTYVLMHNKLQRWERFFGEEAARDRASLAVGREEPWYSSVFSYGSRKAAREYLEETR